MAKETTSARELEMIVAKLHKQRQAHVDAIAGIDSAFAQFGIKPKKRKRRGRPRKVKTRKIKTRKKKAAKKVVKKRKRRTKRKVSGPQSILNFVTRAGKKGVAGSEIVKHWNSEGRGSGAYKEIGILVKAKKLKRHALKGQRGSRYAVA